MLHVGHELVWTKILGRNMSQESQDRHDNILSQNITEQMEWNKHNAVNEINSWI